MSSPLPRGRFGKTLLASLFALSGLAALAGCPGSLDPSLTGSGTGGTGNTGGSSGVCDAPTMVFKSTDTQKGCGAENGCHGAVSKESGLDLVSANVISRLLDKAPDPTTSVACMGTTEVYLKAGSSPPMGLLLDKLNSGSCGLPMPYPVGGLPQAQRDCITQWATAVTTGMITQ
jgi:hypothetical protein